MFMLNKLFESESESIAQYQLLHTFMGISNR